MVDPWSDKPVNITRATAENPHQDAVAQTF